MHGNATQEEISRLNVGHRCNLNIPLYVEKVVEDDLPTVKEALA